MKTPQRNKSAARQRVRAQLEAILEAGETLASGSHYYACNALLAAGLPHAFRQAFWDYAMAIDESCRHYTSALSKLIALGYEFSFYTVDPTSREHRHMMIALLYELVRCGDFTHFQKEQLKRS